MGKMTKGIPLKYHKDIYKNTKNPPRVYSLIYNPKDIRVPSEILQRAFESQHIWGLRLMSPTGV